MKSIISIQLFLIALVGFGNEKMKSTDFLNVSDTTKAISKTKFKSLFLGLDTTNAKQEISQRTVISCSWGTYKLISKKYIIRINTELFSKRFDNFYEINMNPSAVNKYVDLLVYDKLDATLVNICTDVGNWNNPRATQHIKPQHGQIFIGFTRPHNSYDQFDVTVLIKNLVFIDPNTKEVISFKNELIWKVFYDGIPG